MKSVDEEFTRALETVEGKPREAVSSACNILESTCRIYFEDEQLTTPAKQALPGLWTVVRKHLGFDASRLRIRVSRRSAAG